MQVELPRTSLVSLRTVSCSWRGAACRAEVRQEVGVGAGVGFQPEGLCHPHRPLPSPSLHAESLSIPQLHRPHPSRGAAGGRIWPLFQFLVAVGITWLLGASL